MIFGSKQNKAIAEKTTGVMEPMVARAKTAHGFPTGFWMDAYVLGYLLGQINALMSVMGGEALSVADQGRVVVDCFAALSGQKGKPISENAMVFAHHEDADFLRANQNGMFVAMYLSDNIDNADAIPAIIQAKQMADASGAEVTKEAIVDQLVKSFWVDEVRNRLSISA